MKSFFGIVRRPGFWLIVFLFAVNTLLYYQESVHQPLWLTRRLADWGMEGHAFERILYLLPIFLSGIIFSWQASIVAGVIALGIMLPLDFSVSRFPTDAKFETAAVFACGLILSFTLRSLQKEKNQRLGLEAAIQQMRISEGNYRQLFENAHDGILIHDEKYNIISANLACVTLTGYTLPELKTIKLLELLSADSQFDIKSIEHDLFNNLPDVCTIEGRLIKKDKNNLSVQLSINPVQIQSDSQLFQCTLRDISEQKHLEENLRYYLKQVTRAQEEERKRIALELHDETVQYLVVLWRHLELLSLKGTELSIENSQLLHELREQTKNVIQSVRRLSQDLRPATLDRLGLLPALDHLASEVSSYSGIATRLKVLGAERRLPEEVALMLFRITQEALRNTQRHSQATQAEINIDFAEHSVSINIKDNGQGFRLPSHIADLSQIGKLGLVGMQERARLIDAELTFVSEPGKGMSVTVTAPVQAGVLKS